MNPNKYDSASFANLKAGYTCGIIGVSLSAITFLIMVVYLIVIVGIFTTVASAAASSPEFGHAFREAIEQGQNR